MGNDSDFGIGPFVPISERDEQIRREALLAQIWISPENLAFILSVVQAAAATAPDTDEDHENDVLATLAIKHKLNAAEWRLPVLLVMASWRYKQAVH
ncbi:hypothetical protein [Dactylosporangium sp. CA-233914]|uniref:hypothetical protein n=1 Tax=Dactylosporangium sp. CA-233914 TaxID=3239934 RepID=UPI003D908414